MQKSSEIQYSKELEARALEECNREPIEIPGRIQSHGALIAFGFQDLKIRYASENIGEFLNFSDSIFEYRLLDVFGKEDVHSIVNIASHRSAYRQREHVKVIQSESRQIEISLFRWEDVVILELVPLASGFESGTISGNVKQVLAYAHAFQDLQDILDKTVRSLQAITGFGRVMAYTFLPDHSGEVVAESINGDMDSYLGLRFPAFDIPPRARDLFLKNPIRQIGNTSDPGIAVLAANENLPPLDLTYGILRGVSPVHNQYMRNMNIVTSLTLPIIVQGKLWGLFAHHHHSELQLRPDMVYSAEIIGQTLGMAVEHHVRRKTETAVKSLLMEGKDLISTRTNPLELEAFWSQASSRLQGIVKCDGIAYLLDHSVLTHGHCPSESTIEAIEKHYSGTSAGELAFSSDLSEFGLDGLNASRGVLRMEIRPKSPRISLHFYRNEVASQIHWAGNPKKDLEFVENRVRLHPRSSFDHYKELHRGMSDEWEDEEISTARFAQNALQNLARFESDAPDVSGGDGERLRLVVRELNHRVRNILTLVRSISRQTALSEQSITGYVNALEKRINALAEANELLTEGGSQTIGLKEVMEKELLPYHNAFNPVTLVGPKVQLPPDLVPILVLILHELTSNAAKYGALSVRNGELEVSWFRNTEGLRIFWKESQGPPVEEPSRRGFGRTVVEHALQYEFDGQSNLLFLKEGVQAEFFIPASAISGKTTEPPMAVTGKPGSKKKETSGDETVWDILVLEDDFVNAREIIDTLNTLGFSSVHAFSNQESALASMKQRSYRLAILDVNLKGESCQLVARACREKNVDLCYLTGDPDAVLENDSLPRAEVIVKPVDGSKIQQMLDSIIMT